MRLGGGNVKLSASALGDGGGPLVWAVVREGTLDRWTRRDLDALLEPYRA